MRSRFFENGFVLHVLYVLYGYASLTVPTFFCDNIEQNEELRYLLQKLKGENRDGGWRKRGE